VITAAPILLAVLAAALFATAAAAEQRAAAQVAARVRMPSSVRNCVGAGCPPDDREPPVRDSAARLVMIGRQLVNNPLWLAGWLIDALGFLVQATALHFGSLSFVQPLLVTTLLFSLPLAAWGSSLRVRPLEWAGALLVCVGLVLVLVGRHEAESAGRNRHVLLAVAAAVTLAVILVAVARSTEGPVRAALLSVAAATLFSTGAVCTKLVGNRLIGHGPVAVLASWAPYVLVLASIVGLLLQQEAFTVGSLAVSMTAVTITDPLVSYLIGIVGFGEPAPRGAAALAGAVIGVGVLAAGVVTLSRSPLLAPAAGRADGAGLDSTVGEVDGRGRELTIPEARPETASFRS
jgi:drug/metabolite transporter (DMT)-like permease